MESAGGGHNSRKYMDIDGPASHVATLLQHIHQTCRNQDVPNVSYAPGLGGTEGDQSNGIQPGPRSCCCSGHLADRPPHPSEGQVQYVHIIYIYITHSAYGRIII